MGLQIKRLSPIQGRVITTLIAVFALVAQPFYGVVNSRLAYAIPSTVVTSSNSGAMGWSYYGDVDPIYVHDSSAIGEGALKMETIDDSHYIMVDRILAPASTPVLVKDINLSYDTKKIAGPVNHVAPAYVIAIDKDGDLSDDSDTFWAWYEPAYNDTGSENYSEWNTWNITPESIFWYNGSVPTGTSGYKSLSSVIAAHQDAKVTGFTLNMGTGNGGWSALVDNVKTTETTYDFEPLSAPAPSVQTTQIVEAENLDVGGWYFFNDESNTVSSSTAGENEITANPGDLSKGSVKISSADRLNIATNLFAGTNLRDIAQIGYSSYHEQSTADSTYIQFNADFNYKETASGPWQSRLTYVPGTGANSWNSHEGVQNGNGGWVWSGFVANGNKWLDGVTTERRTWNDIINSFPQAKIQDGALGQLLVRSEKNTSNYIDNIYVATATSNVKYDFEQNLPDEIAPSKPTPIFPQNNAVLNAKNLYVDWNESSDNVTSVDQIKYQYRLYSTDPTGTTTEPTVRFKVDYTGTTRHPVAGFADGTKEEVFWWRVQAVDQAGNVSGWTDARKFTIDNTAPTTTIVPPVGVVGSSFVVSGKAEDNHALNRVYVQLVNRQDNKRYGGTTINLIGQGTNATWSKTFDANALSLPDGDYAAHVSVVDMAGNTGSNGWTANFTVDTTAPTNASISFEGDERNGAFRGPITVTGSVDSTVTDVKSHWFEIKGPEGTKYAGYNISANKCTLNDAKTSCTFTLDTSDGDGEYTIRYVAADNVGNRSDDPSYTNTVVATVLVDETPDFLITPPGAEPIIEEENQNNNDTVSGNSDSSSGTTTIVNDVFTQILTPFNFANVLGVTAPVATDEAEEEDAPRVLGEQIVRNDEAVQFDKTAALTPSEDGWTLLGFAWYWWLALLAALAAIGWAIVAAIRRRHDALDF